MAYAGAFAFPPVGCPGTLIITSNRGLLRPETLVNLEDLRNFGTVGIDEADDAYRGPLERDALALKSSAGKACRFVLLGSIATGKYVNVLTAAFKDHLLFPIDFVGRGDLSRGGLCLRAATEGVELPYAAVASAVRKGQRPPKLERLN